MREIVIVHAFLYRKGEGIYLDKLLEDDLRATNKWDNCFHLWWFDYPEQSVMTLEKASWKDNKDISTMLYDAIRFKFECLPNVDAHHFDRSCLHSEFMFNGSAVFEPFCDQLAQIVKYQQVYKATAAFLGHYGIYISWDGERYHITNEHTPLDALYPDRETAYRDALLLAAQKFHELKTQQSKREVK